MNTLNIKSSEILTDSEGKPTIPHQNIMKSELRESIIRSQAILMIPLGLPILLDLLHPLQLQMVLR